MATPIAPRALPHHALPSPTLPSPTLPSPTRSRHTGTPHRRRTRLAAAAASALALALALLVTAVAPAQAASSYRYWGFYVLSGTQWGYAQKGAEQTTPTDGAVEGWRFAVADDSAMRAPRAVLTFDEICATTASQSGMKRVGVVIDYGRQADAGTGTPPAPRSACAVVPTDASAAQVLAAVTTPRTDKGMVCALDGWPATGCGDTVPDPSAAAKAADTPVTIAAPAASPTGTPTGTTATAAAGATTTSGGSGSGGVWAGLIALLVVGGGILLGVRRLGSRHD